MAVLPGHSMSARLLSHIFVFVFLSIYAAATPGHSGGSSAYIRVNQVGYVGKLHQARLSDGQRSRNRSHIRG